MKAIEAWQAARGLLLAAVLVSLAGCGSFYVDGSLRSVEPAKFRKVEPTHPVQVLFEFQTKGVANARATAALKTRALDHVRASGLFSAVSEQPAAGGALLSITVDNVPTDDAAFSKGFVTGLTFGLAGTKVSDGYVCVARYTPPGAAAPLVKQVRHAIHTTLGATSTPENAIKADSLQAAVYTMLEQIVGNVLLEVSGDPAFK